MHILWNRTLFPVQWQRLEILPSRGWLLYFLSQRRANCQTYWGLPVKSRGEARYELWEERSFKTQNSSFGLLRILQLHESILVWLPKPFTVKNMYHGFITKLEAAATCIAYTSAIQLFSWWIFADLISTDVNSTQCCKLLWMVRKHSSEVCEQTWAPRAHVCWRLSY